MKLKNTDKGNQLRQSGNLAAPITFTPYKNTDFANKVCNREVLKQTKVGEKVKQGEYLSAPITHTPFKNTDFTNYVANPNLLKATNIGELVKKGENLAMPITNIREAHREKKWKKKLVTRKVKKKDLENNAAAAS
jgi:hypothetical protein